MFCPLSSAACLIGQLDSRKRSTKFQNTLIAHPYAELDFQAPTQPRVELFSCLHADRVARGDRDYCNTRRSVASGFEQGKGIGQERQLHEQPSSSWPGFRHLLSGPEWPSSVVPELAFYKTGRSDHGSIVSVSELETGVPVSDGQASTCGQITPITTGLARLAFWKYQRSARLQLCHELWHLPRDRAVFLSGADENALVHGRRS